MTAWKKYKLGDLVTFQRGHDLTVTKIIPGKYPVAGSNGIIGYHNTPTTKGPSITLGRSGNSIGVPHYYESDFWAHNTTLYAKKFHNSHPKFIYYLLKSIDLSGHNSGSAVPSLNRNFINPFEVLAPSLPTQTRIAEILSALDDKIELNRRMNETLEQMAQTIFLQYFVNGIHADNLPEGWATGNLGDILSFKNGKSSKERSETAPFAVYGANGIIGYTDEHNAPEKCMIIGRVGSFCGSVYFSLDKAYVTDNAIIATPNFKDTSTFCFQLLQYLKLNNFKGGSGQPLLNQAVLASIDIIIPELSFIKKIEETVIAFYEKICKNEKEISTLITTRDTLLPKLMSGEIDVMKAQKDYEPVLS